MNIIMRGSSSSLKVHWQSEGPILSIPSPFIISPLLAHREHFDIFIYETTCLKCHGAQKEVNQPSCQESCENEGREPFVRHF